MFGVHGTGDTSGYGGLTRTVEMPGSTEPPYGGWMDDVATALVEATRVGGLESAVEKVVVHRGEITFFVRREDLPATAKLLRDDEKLRFEFCSGVSGVHYPDDTGARAARGLPPALDDPQPPDPPRGHLPRRRPAHPQRGGDVPHQRLARARDLRLLRHRLRRPPRTHPHPDARRLAGPPPAQGLPARWHPGRVQGRHHPSARTSGGPTHDDHQRERRLRTRRPRPARDGSSPSPARTGTRSPRASPTSTTTRSS